MLFELKPIPFVDGYGESILSLSDAKAHLKLEADETEEDVLLAALRDSAIDAVEQLTACRLKLTAGLQARFAGFGDVMRLPIGPAGSAMVTAISYEDSAGSPVAMTVGDWLVGVGGRLGPKAGTYWPSGAGAVTVTFSAGWPGGECPASLIGAVRLMLGHLHKNRSAVLATALTGELPLGVETLCSPYRMMGL